MHSHSEFSTWVLRSILRALYSHSERFTHSAIFLTPQVAFFFIISLVVLELCRPVGLKFRDPLASAFTGTKGVRHHAQRLLFLQAE